MARILVVEDDRSLAQILRSYLEDAGHRVAAARDAAGGIRKLLEFSPEIVVTDLMLAEGTGLDILRRARRAPHPPEVILVTAHAESHTAAEAMQDGAYEYITKPYSLDEIGNIVKRVAERRRLVGHAGGGAESPVSRMLVADSSCMRDVLELCRDVAPTATTVLLRGESGTGKEELARYIHEHSPRASAAFVAVNCGAIARDLLTSELFGHEKGAFTGAIATKPGAFEQAQGGSLLLDEIGDISPETQVHLLRVIEAREVTRVGGTAAVPVDVRLIASTHQHLEDLIRKGRFREDLYYRINVYPIQLPPLRKRPEDVPGLVTHFLGEQGTEPDRFTEEALSVLRAYDWPGNIRELRNITENLLIRSRGQPVGPDLVRTVLPSAPVKEQPDGEETLAEMEARKIREALRTAGGNKTEAAKLLGISRRRMYSRMKILGIED